MFRKQNTLDFGFLSSNTFNYNYDYNSVMQFISKNPFIPKLLAEFKSSVEDQENISELLAAVKQGNYNADIFNHRYCQLYSLHLLQHEEIPFQDFFTLNIFLIAFMQFSNLQPIKDKDKDLRRDSVIHFVKFADVREQLIAHMNLRFFEKHTYAKFDLEAFEKSMSELSASENVILAISIDAPFHDEIQKFMLELQSYSTNMFFHEDFYFILSAPMMKIILQTINPKNYMKMAPIFGNINLQTLYQMHQQGFHPVSLYSPYVISNPEIVHGLRAGPLLVLLHDSAAHIPGGGLLPENHYKFIFEYLLPTTAQLLGKNLLEIANYLNLANEAAETPALFKVFDLNLQSRSTYIEKTDPNFYLYECTWNAIGEAENKVEELINIFIKDKNHLLEKYAINIEEVINVLIRDPYFSTTISLDETMTRKFKR